VGAQDTLKKIEIGVSAANENLGVRRPIQRTPAS